MLILSRTVNQSIVIGDNIEVRITRVEGDTVKLGILAPRDISVNRKEIVDSIRESNREAALRDKEGRESSRTPDDVLSSSAREVVSRIVAGSNDTAGVH